MASGETARILQLTDRVARRPTTVDQPTPEDHVILDLDTATYYTVGRVGEFVWLRLDGQQTIQHIVAEVAAEFDVRHDQAEADCLEFVTEMVGHGLARCVR